MKEPNGEHRRFMLDILLSPLRSVIRQAKIEQDADRIINLPPILKAEDVKGDVPVHVKDEPIDLMVVYDDLKPEELSDEQLKEVVRRLANPDAKIKKNIQFDYKFITDRLKDVGFRPFDIPLDRIDANMLKKLFPRQYVNNLYGGSFVETFPTIDKDRVAVHGFDDFMFLHLDFNPHAPVNAGDPGLFFCGSEADKWKGPVQRTFVRLGPSGWLYVGQYRMFPAESLSVEEYFKQAWVVKKTMAQQILQKRWGASIRLAIYLRRHLSREPTSAELADAAENKQVLHEIAQSLSVDDIINAYASGEEEVGVYTMKCVGYDVDFLLTLDRHLQAYKDMRVRDADDPKKQAGREKARKARAARKTKGENTGLRSKQKQLVEDSDSTGTESHEEADKSDEGGTHDRPITL